MTGIPILSQRRLSRALGVHAVAIGIAWFPLVLGVLMSGHVHAIVHLLPVWARGGMVVVGAAVAFPLSWPLLLAAGWHESTLATRIAEGASGAGRRARRILSVEAGVLLALAAGVLVLQWTRLSTGFFSRTDIQLAWLVPALLAAAQLLFAHRFTEAGDPA